MHVRILLFPIAAAALLLANAGRADDSHIATQTTTRAVLKFCDGDDNCVTRLQYCATNRDNASCQHYITGLRKDLTPEADLALCRVIPPCPPVGLAPP
jgi:hypothetical protein